MKCHLSCVRTHGIPPIQCIRNVQEIPCVLGTGNAHEIVPYTVSGNPQEMYKFHVLRNVHTMNRKCDLSYTFLGIFQPRKFKISSSVKYTITFKMFYDVRSYYMLKYIRNNTGKQDWFVVA